MRTTVSIDEALYRELKSRAGSSGRTVSALIEDAVRDSLRSTSTAQESPPLPVFHGRPGVRSGVDLDDNAALRALMDERRLPDAHR